MKKRISILAVLLCAALLLAASAELADFAGDWVGKSGNISLTFTVEADGSGVYAFEQSGYRESYPVQLTVADNTFAVEIPADNALSIADCRGTWQYADGVLTLDVVTAFQNGRKFTYTIPCSRAGNAGNASAAPVLKDFLGRWSAEDQQLIFRDAITWDTTLDELKELKELAGEEKLTEFVVGEDILLLLSQEIIALDQDLAGPVGYVFLEGTLAFVGYEVKPKENGGSTYERICSALSGLYGEATITDWKRVSSYMLQVSSDPAFVSGMESSPWRAWLLPDEKTLAVAYPASDNTAAAFAYFNTPAFPAP